jgi:hypothetical protein
MCTPAFLRIDQKLFPYPKLGAHPRKAAAATLSSVAGVWLFLAAQQLADFRVPNVGHEIITVFQRVNLNNTRPRGQLGGSNDSQISRN